MLVPLVEDVSSEPKWLGLVAIRIGLIRAVVSMQTSSWSGRLAQAVDGVAGLGERPSDVAAVADDDQTVTEKASQSHSHKWAPSLASPAPWSGVDPLKRIQLSPEHMDAISVGSTGLVVACSVDPGVEASVSVSSAFSFAFFAVS
jgi:hypothetical protein